MKDIVPIEKIATKIYHIRGQKVMLAGNKALKKKIEAKWSCLIPMWPSFTMLRQNALMRQLRITPTSFPPVT